MFRIIFLFSFLLSSLSLLAQDAKVPMRKRAEALSYLRNPRVDKTVLGYFDTVTASRKFVISFAPTGQHVHDADSSMGAAGSFVDLMWEYVLADSAQYFDTAAIFTGDTLDGMPEVGYGKAKPFIGNSLKRLDILRNILYLRSIFVFTPGEDKRTYVVETILFADNKSLSLSELNSYAEALANVLTVFVLNKDYTMFPRLTIKVVGEKNVLLDRLLFDTHAIADYY
jgi:hypothetical protein